MAVQTEILNLRSGVDEASNMLKMKESKHLLADVYRWLSPPDPSNNINRARELRHAGSGEWLLKSTTFQEWRSGVRRYLWLHGLAGSGKTVLSAAVLDHIAKAKNQMVLSFFFDFSDRTKQTLDGMLRSLAFQLCQGVVGSTSHLDASFQAHQNGSQQPAMGVLLDIASKMLAAQKKVFIVLDALDESTTREDIILWLQDLACRPELGHIQLLYTSRPESEFQRDIPSLIGEQNCLPLEKQAVNADIRSWVKAQLSQRRDFQEKPLSRDILQAIQRKVGEGADGMYVHGSDEGYADYSLTPCQGLGGRSARWTR